MPTQKDLYKLIAEKFSMEEMKELAHELDVPFDDIGGTTRRDKALELQEYMTRRDRTPPKLARENPGHPSRRHQSLVAYNGRQPHR